jgi:outer membrane lipoprotein SlyB
MSKKYSTLFEGVDLSQHTPEEIMEAKKIYDYIVESNKVAKKEGVTIDDEMDEGIFGALVGSISGALVGPAIGRAICKALGVSESGVLGSLMTSRVVLAAICGELGLQM